MSAPDVAVIAEMMKGTVDKTKMYVDMDQSKAYAVGRPRYTDDMYKVIVDYCKETNDNLDLVVDVGCGPGTSTMGFAKYFKKCIGVDVSETQIAYAPKDIPNCEFKVGHSHQLPFIKTGSVDLFCSGESFNLMPQNETFAEADRVLKPGGTLVIFGHDLPIPDNPEVNEVLYGFAKKTLQYYPKESAQLVNKLRDLQLPYPGWIRNDELKMSFKTTAEKHGDFLYSLWGARAYKNDHPDEDLVEDIKKQINEVLKKQGNGMEFTVNWNLFILMGHKPMK